jgi:hypothetical protein
MTKKEFEDRVEDKFITDKGFEAIHRIYVATGEDFDKDEFCNEFKKINPKIANATVQCICDLIENLNISYNRVEAAHKAYKKYKNNVESILLNSLYADSENSDVYNMVNLNKIIFFKVENAIALSDYDIEQLRNILKVKKQEEECTE